MKKTIRSTFTALSLFGLFLGGCAPPLGDSVESASSGATNSTAQALQVATCGDILKSETTVDTTISSYSCDSSLSFDGTEEVYALDVPAGGNVVVSAVNFDWYPWVAIVRDTGSGVDGANCVSANWYSASATVAPGEQLYVVVDQDGTVPTMTYDLEIDCAAPNTETDCKDGFDDDGDYLVDCNDPDCDSASECQNGFCQDGVSELGCGDQFVTDSTGGPGTTTNIRDWYCGGYYVEAQGPEKVYDFFAEESGYVNVTTSVSDNYTMIAIIEDDGVSGCNANRCVDYNYYSNTFYAVQGQQYYIVVDTLDNSETNYMISLICDPPETETACDDHLDEDGDGFTDCADDDCAADPVCLVSGSCEAAATLTCGDTKIPGDTAGALGSSGLVNYGCDSELVLSHNEVVYELGGFGKGDEVLVTLSDETDYAVVAILEDAGGGCDPNGCIAVDYYNGSFKAEKDKIYYAVVEADGFLSEDISYSVTMICNPPGSEDGTGPDACFDGIDNDGDNFIDCDDTDCSQECDPGEICAAVEALSCGDSLVVGSTANVGATSVIDQTQCLGAPEQLGSEFIYSFDPPASGNVLFTLSDENYYGSIALLEDRGSGCNPYDCQGFQYYSLIAPVQGSKSYFVVVDRPDAADTLDYKISVVCDPPFNEDGLCDDNIDNDGDWVIDCDDQDCAGSAACQTQ